MDTVMAPTYTVEIQGQVFVVEFSPFEWSRSLIAVGLADKVTVGTIRFQEEDETLGENMVFKVLRDFHHDTRVHALAWSPETSLSVVPKCLRFAVAGSDHKLRLYQSDMSKNETVQVLEGHSDYINSVVYEPDSGNQVATVSDDHTCRVWSTENGTEVGCFTLTSPGMSVCWHREEIGKLLAAEKNGVIHIYNVISHQPIMSLQCAATPLMSADWCPVNSLKVAALGRGDWFIWDLSRPSRPVDSRTVHPEGGRHIRFSRTSESHLATTGRPSNMIKVSHTKSTHVPVAGSLQVVGGLSWHYKLPYIAVGSDRKVCLWRVSTI